MDGGGQWLRVTIAAWAWWMVGSGKEEGRLGNVKAGGGEGTFPSENL